MTTEGRIPLEIRKLEEGDEISNFKISLQREKSLNRKEVEETLNSLPDGSPIKVDIEYRREKEE